MVTQIYEIRSKVWVATEIWRPKNMKFWRSFGQFRGLIVIISGLQQGIVSWKMALQTMDTAARANLQLKIGPVFRPTHRP